MDASQKPKTIRKRGRGRPRGIPKPGSGNHPADRAWNARGWLTVDQAAQAGGVSRATVYGWIHRKKLREEQDVRRSDVGAVYVREAAIRAIVAGALPPDDVER